MKTIHRDIVSAVILSKDQKVLLGMKDPKELIYKDLWGIPGGGMEANETKEEALEREVLEETGIDINGYPVELLDDTNSGEAEKKLKDTGEIVYVKMKFYTYKVTITDKNASEIELQMNDDLIKGEWTAREELEAMPLNVPTRWLFSKLNYFL